MSYLKELKDITSTQVLANGMNLRDLLKKEFIDELKSKLSKDYEDIIASDVRLMLVPKLKEPELKEDENGLIIQLKSADFIRFEQPSPDHFKEKVIVITSNKKGVIDKVLK